MVFVEIWNWILSAPESIVSAIIGALIGSVPGFLLYFREMRRNRAKITTEAHGVTEFKRWRYNDYDDIEERSVDWNNDYEGGWTYKLQYEFVIENKGSLPTTVKVVRGALNNFYKEENKTLRLERKNEESGHFSSIRPPFNVDGYSSTIVRAKMDVDRGDYERIQSSRRADIGVFLDHTFGHSDHQKVWGGRPSNRLREFLRRQK